MRIATVQTKEIEQEILDQILAISSVSFGSIDEYNNRIHNLYRDIDLIVVIGGDGSMLRVSRYAVQYNIPMYGINAGRIGFLTDVSPKEIYKLTEVLEGKYKSEYKTMIETKIVDRYYHALNEICIYADDVDNEKKLVEIYVYIDNEYTCRYRSDGIILSTATGSTAYALSCGGTILEQCMDAFILIPVLSYNLNSRYIAICTDHLVSFETREMDTFTVYCDGKKIGERIQKISLNKYAKKCEILHHISYNYFKNLTEKLGWETIR